MITFKKQLNDIWVAEYTIFYYGNSVGFIYKCCKKSRWNVFVRGVFTPVKDNDQFDTLKAAKAAVIKEKAKLAQAKKIKYFL